MISPGTLSGSALRVFAPLRDASVRRADSHLLKRFVSGMLFALAGFASTSPSLVAQSMTSPRLPQPAPEFISEPVDSNFGTLIPSLPVGIKPAEIIHRFAAKESEFKHALANYTYRRTVKFDTLDKGGNVDGEYLQVDDIIFISSGHKREKVVFAPDNTLTRVAMSPADFDDIEHRLPFTLTTEDIGQYQLTYVGKQAIGYTNTYVFDVAPKQIEENCRYFVGRIWVDAHDFQIIVTTGKNIPDNTHAEQEDLSIPFTTYRQQIDGKYWFPVYSRAEGVLHFKNCKECLPEDDHLRELVKYTDYKRFGSSIRIIYDGSGLADDASQPSTVSSTGDTPANSSGNPLPPSSISGPLQINATKE